MGELARMCADAHYFIFQKEELDMLNPLPSTAITANRKKMGLKKRDWSNFENGTKTLKGIRT